MLLLHVCFAFAFVRYFSQCICIQLHRLNVYIDTLHAFLNALSSSVSVCAEWLHMLLISTEKIMKHTACAHKHTHCSINKLQIAFACLVFTYCFFRYIYFNSIEFIYKLQWKKVADPYNLYTYFYYEINLTACKFNWLYLFCIFIWIPEILLLIFPLKKSISAI